MNIKVKIIHPIKNIRALKTVLKINTKGILLAHSKPFELGDELKVILNKDLILEGKILKFSKNKKGQQGMIVGFSPFSNQKKVALLSLLGRKIKKVKPSPEDTLNSPHQDSLANIDETIITSLNSLEHLSLQSPDQKPRFVSSTLDEEGLKKPILNQYVNKTKVEAYIPQIAPQRKLRLSKKLIFFFCSCFVILFLFFGIRKKFNAEKTLPEIKIESQQKKNISKSPQKKSLNKRSTQPSRLRSQKKSGSIVLSNKTNFTQLTQHTLAAFQKISLTANKNLSSVKITKLAKPMRLRIEFDKSNLGALKSKYASNSNKIKYILVQQKKHSTRFEIFFKTKTFPRYDIKTYDRFSDIFIYR